MFILRCLLVLVFLDSFVFAGSNKASAQSRDSSNVDYGTAGIDALQLFNTANVRYALTYLASDSLQGRETTEPGQKKAADFIARRFKETRFETAWR